ncbi:MAG: hypothetical protein OMM_12758, partial [Candidatus Magnetoglobus multicellularis str. Araruama]
MQYRAYLEDGSRLPSWLRLDAITGTFSGKPSNNDIGEYFIKVMALDNYYTSAYDVFKLSVLNDNDSPKLSSEIPDQTALENSPFSFT